MEMNTSRYACVLLGHFSVYMMFLLFICFGFSPPVFDLHCIFTEFGFGEWGTQ